jgi:hypothetical protein
MRYLAAAAQNSILVGDHAPLLAALSIGIRRRLPPLYTRSDLERQEVSLGLIAEQAEQSGGNHEVKCEGFAQCVERSITFPDETASKSTTSTMGTPLPHLVAITNSHRNSIGYFSRKPSFPRRSTDTSGGEYHLVKWLR